MSSNAKFLMENIILLCSVHVYLNTCDLLLFKPVLNAQFKKAAFMINATLFSKWLPNENHWRILSSKQITNCENNRFLKKKLNAFTELIYVFFRVIRFTSIKIFSSTA